jgi:hypothetical protein
MMKKKRKDLTMDIIIGSRKGIGSPLTGGKISWQDAARECGIDVNLYKNVDGIFIIRHGISSQNITKCYPADNLDDSWPLKNNGRSGVSSITSSYWEMFSHNKILDPVRKMWPAVKATQMPVRTIIDTGNGILAPTAYAIMKHDIQTVYIGGMGVPATAGHEKQIREFARAFRSLPPVLFDDFDGMEDPVRLRSKTVDGSTWFYLVNAEPYSIAVDLQLSRMPKNIIDIGKNSRLKLASEKMRLFVEPYQLRSFKMDRRAKVVGANTVIPQNEYQALRKRLVNCSVGEKKIINMHAPEKAGGVYLWREAESWDAWDTTERLGLKRGPRKNIKDVMISGADYISFGGSLVPTIYNMRIPRSSKYAVWVKFVTPEVNRKQSNWVITINGKKFAEIKTPVAGEKLWVKFGETDLDAGTAKLELLHRTPAYSVAVDSILVTSDSDYVPSGPADYDSRAIAYRNRFGLAVKAMRKKHLALARAIITALENVK